MPKLYLIPSYISDSPSGMVIPEDVKSLVGNLRFFAVENVREARRFLRRLHRDFDIDGSVFYTLDKRTPVEELDEMIEVLRNGNDLGIISDAGCPGIADPGSLLVDRAHQLGFSVEPLVGPSSILLALMGSGLNGQQFCFHGYLPKDQKSRISFLKKLEFRVLKQSETQLFMDTPFRNDYVIEDVINHCAGSMKFTIACNLSGSDQYLVTKSIDDWKKVNLSSLNKKPCIFLLGK